MIVRKKLCSETYQPVDKIDLYIQMAWFECERFRKWLVFKLKHVKIFIMKISDHASFIFKKKKKNKEKKKRKLKMKMKFPDTFHHIIDNIIR